MSRYSNRTPLVRDNNGKPIVGAYTHFYAPGTTTYKTIYSDSDFSTAIANPVRSLAGGILPTIFLDGIYKVVQNDEDDAFLWPSEDPVGEVAAGQFDDWLNDKSYSFNDIVKGSDLALYRSLVAGIETNQGNDPISSPTEWGDATFATIDGIETLTNKTLTSPIINAPTINGESGYGLVVLDTPETLLGTTAVPATTNTNEGSTTLDNANAVKAIIRVIIGASTGDSISLLAAYDDITMSITRDKKAEAADSETNTITFIVNLDSNNDFWWKTVRSGTVTLTIYLDGYYV